MIPVLSMGNSLLFFISCIEILILSEFGVAKVTVLVTVAFLMLLGIYDSASLLSTNYGLHKFIRKHALTQASESYQVKPIWRKNFKKPKEDAGITNETSFELNEKDLKNYLGHVNRGVR